MTTKYRHITPTRGVEFITMGTLYRFKLVCQVSTLNPKQLICEIYQISSNGMCIIANTVDLSSITVDYDKSRSDEDKIDLIKFNLQEMKEFISVIYSK